MPVKKAAKKVVKKSSVKKAPAKIPLDALGNRAGTQAAQVNATLSRRPMTTDQIMFKTGLPRWRVQSHLKSLLDKKLILETDKGYRLP